MPDRPLHRRLPHLRREILICGYKTIAPSPAPPLQPPPLQPTAATRQIPPNPAKSANLPPLPSLQPLLVRHRRAGLPPGTKPAQAAIIRRLGLMHRVNKISELTRRLAEVTLIKLCKQILTA